jgi:hypothetical protein
MKYKSTNKASQNARLRENLKLHVPTDYPWRVLGALAEDLDYLLTDSEKCRLSGIVRSRDYDAYLQLSEDWGPQSSTLGGKTRAEAQALYQVVSLIRKFRFPSDNAIRKTAAIEKFTAAETVCRDFNQNSWSKLAGIEDVNMLSAFSHARSYLVKLLGNELPGQEKLTEWSRHGPGANLDTLDGRISKYYKYADWPYSCTQDALGEAICLIMDDERWLNALVADYIDRYNLPKCRKLDNALFWQRVITIVPGNRITFVPKNAQTDRSIAIEPSLNLMLQLGIDGYIRRRLRRWGVDLDDQGKNREMARLGSRDWENPNNFVTLDLAAASDTISAKVCELLLPGQWYNHLMKLRSPCGVLGKESIAYAKISSMGNGYTFALESAVFSAVVYGVQCAFKGSFDRNASAIYGDDLIVESAIAKPVIELLNLCGFTINTEKSFFEGPFRESCGADWFKGSPVRPVFLETPPSTVMELWTDLNRLRRFLALRVMVFQSKTEALLVKWIPQYFADFTGPASDELFDCYRHVDGPSTKSDRNGLWAYKRVIVTPRECKVKSFNFKKLMHDLRGQTVAQNRYPSFYDRWKGCAISGKGSRFTVTKPFSVTVTSKVSRTSVWCDEYTETPAWTYSSLSA